MKQQLFLFFVVCSMAVNAQYTLTDADVTVVAGVITAYTPQTTDKDIIIPETLDGQTVTAIGNGAFNTTGLTGVVIPNTVITIEDYAFQSNDLTSLTLGNSVETIGEWSFTYNGDLTELVIPNSVTSIGYVAFAITGLTSLTLGNSVETIEAFAFQNTHLTDLIIPNSVTIIKNNAFVNNPLETVLLTSDPTIEGGAFNNITFYEVDLSFDSGAGDFSYVGNHSNTYSNIESGKLLVKAGTDFVVTPVKEGYTSFSPENLTVTNIAANTTQEFVGTAISYDITYNLDGGEGTNPATYTVDDEIVFQAPTKEGYVFEGWYTEDTFTNVITGIVTGNTGDIEVFAKWSVTLGLEDAVLSSISVYPNPSNGVFQLDLGTEVPTRISVYDINGRLVKSLPNEFSQEVNLDIEQGVYLLQIETEQGSKQIKLLITE